ncbi:DNA replication and repair protein RecF [Spirochaetia bacterium]|nr:DNA replication and repair protein RecF [Spirochaetia bacterium]
MIFESLRTAAFRNLADAEVFTGGKDVFLVGENGQGKTNFLEALYFSSYASSFRGVKDNELARTGEKDYSAAVKIKDVDGSFASHDQVLVKYEQGKKTVHIDGKRVEDRKELLSVIPCIVFCHEDMEFVAGSPEQRRWFFDQSLSLYDPVYLDDLRRYRRVLKTRNAILREKPIAGGAIEILDALDPQIASYGLKLMEKREDAARLFSALFGPLYEDVSGIGDIAVRYAPSWKNDTLEKITGFLLERRELDMAAGVSLSGPHRDRYIFTRGSAEFAAKASTGQRRLLALLLRVAQARRFSETTGKNPVLLLDDVLLEMDGEKRRKFLSVMPEYDQAFYTFLPEEPYERYRKSGTLVYYMNSGGVSPGPGSAAASSGKGVSL